MAPSSVVEQRGPRGSHCSITPALQHSNTPSLHHSITPFPLKIAVVGCGAVGSFYGAKLARAGHEVHFLLRSDYDTVRRQGVLIRSLEGDFQVQPQCARRPEEIGPADLVLIGLKTTANEAFAKLLPPLVGSGTAVLTLQNGLGNEEDLARLFPVEQIMGGLCFVCLNRLAPGMIQHIGYGQVILGEFQRQPEPHTHDRAGVRPSPGAATSTSSEIPEHSGVPGRSEAAAPEDGRTPLVRLSCAPTDLAGWFTAAGVACTVTDNLARAHWEKLVWNVPFNGLGVAAVAGFDALAHPSPNPQPSTINPQPSTSAECLTTDKLLADARWARLVRDLMLEVIAAARALGFDVPDAFADQQIERTRTMGAYRASTLIDFERGQPLELQSLFLEPLRQATRARVAMPRLSALCEVLKDLDRRARLAR
jgi:2-dehydropantoate 2-reductase